MSVYVLRAPSSSPLSPWNQNGATPASTSFSVRSRKYGPTMVNAPFSSQCEVVSSGGEWK